MTHTAESIASASSQRVEWDLGKLETEYRIPVASCEGYRDVLMGSYGEKIDARELLSMAAEHGRLMLPGRGACGKTTLLRRLVKLATDQGQVPVFIDLSLWGAGATGEWRKVSQSAREAVNFLIRTCNPLGLDLTDLEFLPAHIKKLLIVDGLNETPGSTANEIASALDEVAALVPGMSVIVSDRLTRRDLKRPERWAYAAPLPIDSPQISHVLGRTVTDVEASLLSSPFFLERAEHGQLQESRIQAFRELVENDLRSSDSLPAAAHGAYDMYEKAGTRSFPLADFMAVAGEEATRRLQDSGSLTRVSDGVVAFNHHLIHDYLAALHIAQNLELLDGDRRQTVLDILTFKANSFDAVAFLLELVPEGEVGRVLRAIYDWNPYAAGYAMSEISATGADRIPGGLRTVILTMLAEKRFDRQFDTARRAQDALDLLSLRGAEPFQKAESWSDIVALVRAKDFDEESFRTWQRWIILDAGSEAPSELVDALSVEDSILGWTASNILRKLTLSSEQIDAVVALSSAERPVVRWRACHVMGSRLDARFTAALFRCLESDEDENVRYGAVRSLIESASLPGADLNETVQGIQSRLDAIKRYPRVLAELTKSVLLSEQVPVPPNWSNAMSEIFYDLQMREEDMQRAEHWSSVMSNIRSHHRASQAATV